MGPCCCAAGVARNTCGDAHLCRVLGYLVRRPARSALQRSFHDKQRGEGGEEAQDGAEKEKSPRRNENDGNKNEADSGRRAQLPRPSDSVATRGSNIGRLSAYRPMGPGRFHVATCCHRLCRSQSHSSRSSVEQRVEKGGQDVGVKR